MDKEGQHPTACIRNSGFSAKSKVSTFNKSQCQTESEVLLNRYFSYTQNVIFHSKRRSVKQNKDLKKRVQDFSILLLENKNHSLSNPFSFASIKFLWLKVLINCS